MTRPEIVQRLVRELALDFGEEMAWTYKIAALLEGDQLAFLDALRNDAPRGAPWTGEILALTETRVVRARIKVPPETEGTMVTTWSRRALRSLRVEGPDNYWAGLHDGLAPETRLRLKYQGRAPLVIPLDPTVRSRSGELADLLPSLLDDLGR